MSGRRGSGFWFCVPWLLGLLLLTIVPGVLAGWMSLHDWDGVRSWREAEYVGADHFVRAVRLGDGVDETFRKAMRNSIVYSLAAAPMGVVAALVLALLLHRPVRGIGFFRGLFYLPHLLSGAATVLIWSWLFNPRFGPINDALRWLYGLLDPVVRLFGGEGTADWGLPEWLQSPFWCKPALVIMHMWHVGGSMLIFLAALHQVPRHLEESARLDGAGGWRRFWHITWPHLTPVVLFNLVFGLVACMQSFDQSYLLQHWSQRDGLLFFVLYLYRVAFEPPYQMGYASALAWILFLLVFVPSVLLVVTGRRWVYYQARA
jgi:multiple sugar transport system permease protein